jgi:hypothetical protein
MIVRAPEGDERSTGATRGLREEVGVLTRSAFAQEDRGMEDLRAVELLLGGEAEQQRPRIARGMGRDHDAALCMHVVGDGRERQRGVDAALETDREEMVRAVGDLLRRQHDEVRREVAREDPCHRTAEPGVVLGDRHEVELAPVREERDVDRRRERAGEGGVDVHVALEDPELADARWRPRALGPPMKHAREEREREQHQHHRESPESSEHHGRPTG